MRLSRTAIAASVAAVLMGSAASAATMDLVYQGTTPWGTPDWHENTIVTVEGKSFGVGAGLMRLFDKVSDSAVMAFCVDVTRWLTDPPGEYNVLPSMFGGMVQTNIQKLFDTAYTKVKDASTAAGFQIALWEIIHEKGQAYNITSGAFRAHASAAAARNANEYLAGLSGAATQHYQLGFLDSQITNVPGYGQDLVLPTVAAVPLPATALLLGGAVAGLGAVRRRRQAA